ncbi:multidrug effflux MFS transporter [Afifella pfennigii]|uniref:multidrug effflux MFS transporter n=1 Tax=Afifella pfennigii TaxID=209897 RepID=UPI00068EC654|nr:multidrug effflux MFS transporter [Afifella pfennigii]
MSSSSLERADAEPASPIPYVEFVALVATLMALNALAIDVILPALDNISGEFALADENSRQFVVTAYVIGFGAAQLAWGPLSDRFGRKPVLLVGLVIYGLGALAAGLATGFSMLLACRLIQGIGAAATRVVAISVVRDVFGGRRMASVMSLVMMVFMAVPIVAPSLGQLVLFAASWHWIFVVMGLYGLGMILWSAIRLPETLADEYRRPLSAGKVAEAFAIVLTNRQALGYTLATALIFGGLFSFLNSSQQIYVEIFDLGAWFPVAFGASAIPIAAASFTNSRLVGRFGMRFLSHAALIGYCALAFLMTLASVLTPGLLGFWPFFVLISLIFCLFGFVGTNFNALAMEPLGHVAGTASSVLGFMQTFGGGFFGAIVGYLYNGTVTPFASGLTVLSLLAIGAIFIAEGGTLFRARHAPLKS